MFRASEKAVRTFERFAMPEPNSGCWLWTGALNNKGYGVMQVHGEFKGYAHRFAYEHFVGDIGDLYVCHRCDMPMCCNPDHLFLGTQADNMRDAKRKGRHGSVTRPGAYLRGEQLSFARLTEENVVEIFLSPQHPSSFFAQKFNVARTTVRSVRRGKTWRHVTEKLGPSPSELREIVADVFRKAGVSA